MKVVIDIPEDRYRQIKDLPNAFNSDICKAIRNGTPLPKGHGNLVDADKVILGLVYGKHIDNAKCGEITEIFDNAVVIPADMRGEKDCRDCQYGTSLTDIANSIIAELKEEGIEPTLDNITKRLGEYLDREDT